MIEFDTKMLKPLRNVEKTLKHHKHFVLGRGKYTLLRGVCLSAGERKAVELIIPDKQFKKTGADECLVKDCELDEVLQKVSEFLDKFGRED